MGDSFLGGHFRRTFLKEIQKDGDIILGKLEGLREDKKNLVIISFWGVSASGFHTVSISGLDRLPRILALISGWGGFREREDTFLVD